MKEGCKMKEYQKLVNLVSYVEGIDVDEADLKCLDITIKQGMRIEDAYSFFSKFGFLPLGWSFHHIYIVMKMGFQRACEEQPWKEWGYDIGFEITKPSKILISLSSAQKNDSARAEEARKFEIAIDEFSIHMKLRMHSKLLQGFVGWDKKTSQESCHVAERLERKVGKLMSGCGSFGKKDLVDIAVTAMMLHYTWED
jgi:hypothetical protein